MTTKSFSSGFTYIDKALKNHWDGFQHLSHNFSQFRPLTLEELRNTRGKEWFPIFRNSNPSLSTDQVTEKLDEHLKTLLHPSVQEYLNFGDSIMSTYVNIAFLSHALCESIINAFLAEGLSHIGKTDVFHLIEKSEFRDKWLYGPKAFIDNYNFPKNTALYETLQRLNKQRNAYIHSVVSG